MRPHPGVTLALFITLTCGLLSALSLFSREDGTGTYQQKGTAILILTAMIVILLTLVATAKMRWPHLWKKNSTHKRHHQHTRHHPAVKNQDRLRKR